MDREEILNEKSETWQETSYKLYLRTNRLYKIIVYYAWRFTEIHIHKLIFFLMVLLSVLKVRRIFLKNPSHLLCLDLCIQCYIDSLSDYWFNILQPSKIDLFDYISRNRSLHSRSDVLSIKNRGD